MTREQVEREIASMKERAAANKKRHSVSLLESKPKVKHALAFARTAHHGQKRKYDGADYIDHPIEVANILIEHKVADERALCVAILHDTIEDTHVTYDQLRMTFGDQIARDVKALTCPPPSPGTNRAKRKSAATANTVAAGPTAMMVKIADIISNISDVALHDPTFASTYLEEKKASLRKFSDSATPRSNPNVRALLDTAYKTYSEALNQLALTVLAEENERVVVEAENEAEIQAIIMRESLDDMAEIALF
jgi:(p)ppGpp synthase/HD superfamily hydrolase